MRGLDVAPRAIEELATLLAWSEERFGPAATDRYRDLISAAVDDIREDPERPGSRTFEGRSLYPIRHSRARLYGPRVGAPRHVLIYRFDATTLTLLRVLHDAMDLPARLTDEA